jgi:hypothetical protein
MVQVLSDKRGRSMRNQKRRAGYASLWVFALAFGWIEASVVVYLRQIYMREAALNATSGLEGLQITLVSLPGHLVGLEMAREACTILLLGAVAWLAGSRSRERVGAFLLSFGVWDLTYYAVLKLVAAWPDSLSTWDILFLIPLPWVAPVWAPATVATVFVLAGSYLFWTAEHERSYRWPDVVILAASALMTIAAFLVESQAAIDHQVPERFPLWLFSAGVIVGTAWFLRVEQGTAGDKDKPRPWVGVRVRTIPPESRARLKPSKEAFVVSNPSSEGHEVDVGRVISEYTEAKQRLDALLNEAGELGERFERLSHGLTAHPRRMIIGIPDRRVEDPSEWDVVPSHPLPTIESLSRLTDDIREATLIVEPLRARLILMGQADLVQQPDGFFR